MCIALGQPLSTLPHLTPHLGEGPVPCELEDTDSGARPTRLRFRSLEPGSASLQTARRRFGALSPPFPSIRRPTGQVPGAVSVAVRGPACRGRLGSAAGGPAPRRQPLCT